jgi:hypothetical protein
MSLAGAVGRRAAISASDDVSSSGVLVAGFGAEPRLEASSLSDVVEAVALLAADVPCAAVSDGLAEACSTAKFISAFWVTSAEDSARREGCLAAV